MTMAETVVGRDGRAKAYRPIPAEEREVALDKAEALQQVG